MLMNEVLQKTREAKEAFILLKLDTIKAFDCMGWSFLKRLLQRIGIGPNFIKMIEASYEAVDVSILIQGHLSAPIPLKCSICQGCPLSPLLYLIVANALSIVIIGATNKGIIKGVPIVEMGDQYTHGQFIDDTSVIIEAKTQYVEATFEIFKDMSLAFGLYVKVTKVKVVFISNNPMSTNILAFGFNWETKANLSKLLGFFMGEDISPSRML